MSYPFDCFFLSGMVVSDLLNAVEQLILEKGFLKWDLVRYRGFFGLDWLLLLYFVFLLLLVG